MDVAAVSGGIQVNCVELKDSILTNYRMAVKM